MRDSIVHSKAFTVRIKETGEYGIVMPHYHHSLGDHVTCPVRLDTGVWKAYAPNEWETWGAGS